MVGKNFSTNNLGQRKKSDFYETPYSITQQLIDYEYFEGVNTLEPACGEGAIVRVLQESGFTVVSYDKEKDFLLETKSYEELITNPPFSLALEFILKAKQIITSKFALLLPLSYLHGKERYNKIYLDEIFPLSKVLVFTRYPMLGNELREDGKYTTGMMVYAWFIWDKTHVGPATIHHLDNNDYIVSKRDL